METRLQKLILTTILAAFAVVGQGVLGSGGVTAPGPLPAKPNILFLFADDQRADTISAWGNENIRTPNLDRLVARGFSFRRNYCFGSNSGAVCRRNVQTRFEICAAQLPPEGVTLGVEPSEPESTKAAPASSHAHAWFVPNAQKSSALAPGAKQARLTSAATSARA